jgi:hypothetical protein
VKEEQAWCDHVTSEKEEHWPATQRALLGCVKTGISGGHATFPSLRLALRSAQRGGRPKAMRRGGWLSGVSLPGPLGPFVFDTPLHWPRRILALLIVAWAPNSQLSLGATCSSVRPD